MGYILNQYNKSISKQEESSNAPSNLIFMTPILGGTPRRKQNAADNGVTGDAAIPFSDECIQTTEPLYAGRNYYFHGKIKRLDSEQKFYIKLINYEDPEIGLQDAKEQYIKTIIVQGGDYNEWVDVEFMFTPIIQYDTIIFQLQRTIADYREATRYPTIVYQELSIINNIIPSQIADGINLLKIGVQSRPGLKMCINGEEIRIGRTGIYEVRNGMMTISFFSVVTAATESSEKYAGMAMGEFLTDLSTIEGNDDVITSVCIFDSPKNRSIDPFTLDYLYKEV